MIDCDKARPPPPLGENLRDEQSETLFNARNQALYGPIFALKHQNATQR